MNQDSLFALLGEARKLCGHAEYVVIGSLSILGVADITAIPADMTISIDADCYARADPSRTLDLQMALGEGSEFHKAHGFYLDPVNPRLPTLPDGWEARLIRLARVGVIASFLEPHDAAVSKLARGEARDLRWVRSGVKANILSLTTLVLRMKSTSFLDLAEQQSALARVEKLKSPRGR
jgi:hypothetical protein